ncbi:MAG: FxsA family protein [Rhodospirillales bacterium]|nr:FxsA family protein [Rhodospirillales bacterium]
MGLFILAAFIIIPIIEIGLFVQVGGAIGLWPTLLIVIVTGMVGIVLLRLQGLIALTRLQQSLERGEAPLEPIFDGFCLLAAGLLLLLPGFFTDSLGLILLLPPVRHLLRHLLARQVRVQGHMHYSSSSSQHSGRTTIIDGEWQDVTDADDPSRPLPKLDQNRPEKD